MTANRILFLVIWLLPSQAARPLSPRRSKSILKTKQQCEDGVRRWFAAIGGHPHAYVPKVTKPSGLIGQAGFQAISQAWSSGSAT